MGAAVLVLLGVVGFPLLFDTQPRSVPVDISIDIPAKNAVKPAGTSLPTAPVASAVVASVAQPPEAAAVASAAASVAAPAATPSPTAPPAPAAPAPAAKKEAEAKPAPAPPEADDSARAKALLEGKTQPQASTTTELRLVLQVGAYADAAKAREARLKLEKAGIKTYTQVVGTKDAQRTRVRVGPFTTRADADKAADKIKALDLPVTVLTL